MSDKTNALHEGLKKMLNYLPMIYNQQVDANKEYDFIIKYPYDSIPDNALLFVLPLTSSKPKDINNNKYNKLVIKRARVYPDGTISYENISEYKILCEGSDGKKRYADKGDIIANRLCMFRFISNNSTEIILCNNPIYNNIGCSELIVTGDSTFSKPPTVPLENGETTLALNADLQDLVKRVEALENKFKIGTDSADKFFEENELPDGTIYLQVEE